MPSLEKEKKVIQIMIGLYCKKNHHATELCEQCSQLMVYAFSRIDKCPFASEKPKCSKCLTHCFKNDKREEIKKVMRYSGPRMIYYHPVIAIKHLLRK